MTPAGREGRGQDDHLDRPVEHHVMRSLVSGDGFDVPQDFSVYFRSM
ncbi:hypothetical protein [Mycobacterium sp. SMC-8]|nr:hypothetical protein [Mycobacterium sp. SMC-8]